MTYGLVMIVKDARPDLERTLPTFARHITSWIVCDTGSTDGTPEIVRRLLSGIPGELFDDPWVNFGHNRSLALSRARGTADWLLLMDADMSLEIDPGWEPDSAVDAYMIEMGRHTDYSYRLPLLVRGDLPWISVGAVHEYTALEGGHPFTRRNTDHVRVDMGAQHRGSPEKYEWHLGMLLDDWRREQSPRTAYYIGQTFRSLGRSEEAREWFLRRAGMAGWEEERYCAAYGAAMLAPDWPTQMTELLAAWESRPGRLEAVQALARGLNARDMHQAAYALASITPPLCTDELFVQRWIWDWGLKLERSIAAWWTGRIAESRTLCDELLANPRLPEGTRALVRANRRFCEVAA